MRELAADLICVPWGHHIQILTKCKSRDQAIFYVRRAIQNGWSRNTLLNWLSTDLYEREGKGRTNFALTMPSDDWDLAPQLVKDPQVFEVFGLREQYNESEFKSAIVANIPTPAQLAKCYADAEAQIVSSVSVAATKPTVKRSPKQQHPQAVGRRGFASSAVSIRRHD